MVNLKKVLIMGAFLLLKRYLLIEHKKNLLLNKICGVNFHFSTLAFKCGKIHALNHHMAFQIVLKPSGLSLEVERFNQLIQI